MSRSFRNRFVRQLSTVYVILSSTPRYWPFLLRPGNPFWTLTPVILVWAVSYVRSGMMWSVWSLIAVTPLDLHRDVTAQQSVRCWPLWPCAYSSGHTCVTPSSRITSHWCGCTGSSYQFSTGPVGIMVTRTVSGEFPRCRAGNVRDRTVHRPMKL